MRRWVKPFLLENVPFEDRHKKLDEVCIWNELASYFQYDFGNEGDLMILHFGSVLADLPKEAFEKLRKRTDVYFVHTSSPNADVKFIRRKGKSKDDWVCIVNFAFDTMSTTEHVIRGIIAHELAHIYLNHKLLDPEEREVDLRTWIKEREADLRAKRWIEEREVDLLLIQWGFLNELMDVKDYFEEHFKSREGQMSEEIWI